MGYAARWSVCAGDKLGFHISCTKPEFRVELRRLIHGDRNPAGPGTREEVVDHPLNRRVFAGQVQAIQTGSCMRVESMKNPSGSRNIRYMYISASRRR